MTLQTSTHIGHVELGRLNPFSEGASHSVHLFKDQGRFLADAVVDRDV